MTSASVLHSQSSTSTSTGFNSSSGFVNNSVTAGVVVSSSNPAPSLPLARAATGGVEQAADKPTTSMTPSGTFFSDSISPLSGSTGSVSTIALTTTEEEEAVAGKGEKKLSRRRRTSDTILATTSAILRMLGVSSGPGTSASPDGAGNSRHTESVPKIAAEVTTQSQARKNSTTISKVKASSLSECDRFEEMLEPKMKRPSEGEVSIDPIPMGSRVHPDHVAVKQKIECTNSLKPVDQLPDRPKTNMPTKRSANDFRFGKTIGEGSFSTVYLAKDIHTGKECAIKVCEKKLILREKKQEYIKREREVMNLMSGCRGFVNLYCTFQDPMRLYFVMTYAKNGDLLPHINKVGSLDQAATRFYAAELVLALENMHRRGVIHRDLKPENVLLDEKMHTLIADFGSAKIVEGNVSRNDTDSNSAPVTCATDTAACNKVLSGQGDPNTQHQRARKNSFVGTAQYVSPEILKGQPSTTAVDLWALGCIVYQMVSGLPPFRGGSEYLIFQSILKHELSFPDGFDSNARDLVEKLLVLDPCERIGAKDKDRYNSIRSHSFFVGIDWERLHQQEPPKIYPYLPGIEEPESSTYKVPDHLEPGLGEKQLTRLLGLDLGTLQAELTAGDNGVGEEKSIKTMQPESIADVSEPEKRIRLEKQKTDKWDAFAEGELILKQGFVNKRKGLFARKRMLLLTTGPRLIYIDPVQMVKKGEITWSEELRVEPKNFKIFFVHTPNRTYYLEDPDGFALRWCDAIKDVRRFTYGESSASTTMTAPSTINNSEYGNRMINYRYSSS